MIELLTEGLESAFLPCSYILLLPGAAAGFAARTKESSWALAGFAAGSLGVAWFRYSDRLGEVGTAVPAIMLAAALTFLAVPLVRRITAVAIAGGSSVGAAAAFLWEPCVGSEFGLLLGELPGAGIGSLAELALYMLGVLAPLIVVGGIMAALPAPLMFAARPLLLGAAVLTLGGLAVATALGYHDDLVGQLVQWSI